MKNSTIYCIVLTVFSFASLNGHAEELSKAKPGVAGGATEIVQGPDSEGVSNKVYLVSWGDLIFFFGPGTDPGLNTREQITRIISEWKRRGCTYVFWRTEKEDPDFKTNASTINSEGSFIMAEIKKLNARDDTTAIARDVCRQLGLKFYIWNSIYDDGTPADKYHRFWKTGFPWRNTFFDRHPELEVRDRKGNVQWGVREMAYPLARQHKIDEYVKLVQKYHPDGVFFYLHSHSAAGFHGDQFGFNQPIVDEYKKRYGINILTDPRFNFEDPSFDPANEMVEKWRALRGEYLTTFFREAKTALQKEEPGLGIAINTQGGDWLGPPFGNMKTDWRTWIKEGLANILLLRTWMAGGCGAYDFGKEGYLTWADGGLGTTPYPEIKAEVKKSGHDILVISRERQKLEGADGYFDASARLDLEYARKQRSEQLTENMKRDGVIHFIQQDFEKISPLEKNGFLDFGFEGKRFFIGDSRYYPETNSSPGFAGPLTEDANRSPALVDLSSTGRKGWGVLLADPQTPFTIFRRTGSDFPDDAIAVGEARITVDVYCSPGTSLKIELGRRNEFSPENPRITIGPEGAISVFDEGKLSKPVGTLSSRSWGTVQFDANFSSNTWTLSLNGKSIATRPLDSAKASIDAIRFTVSSGTASIDNIQANWAWQPSKSPR